MPEPVDAAVSPSAAPRGPQRPPLDRTSLAVALGAPRGPLARLDVVERSGSTNTDLAASARTTPDAYPVPALLVADHQDAGRGRVGRTWQTPARAAVTASLLVETGVPAARRSWLPLLVGLGVVRGLRAVTGLAPVLKWPNDVLLPATGAPVEGWGPYRKAVGILVEAVPGTQDRYVAGFGINVTQTAAELPVPSATSLALAGSVTTDRAVVLDAVVRAVLGLLDAWRATGGDPWQEGPAGVLAQAVQDACVTVGARVAVDLVDGSVLDGTADGLGPAGELLLRTDAGTERAVVTGDVRHVRTGRADTLGG